MPKPDRPNNSTRRRNIGKRKKRQENTPSPDGAPLGDGPVRINRFLARAGVASRREADTLVADGRVTINGEVVTELGTKVSPSDQVEFDGHPITPQTPVYILLNKPRDTITTKSDEKDRRTVMDLVDLPEHEKAALFPVGRLDRNTTGVLLLTNDGDLAHRLMHPRYEVEKLYVVKTLDSVKPDQIDSLREGIELEDGIAKADHAAYFGTDRKTIALQIHEGRNRQVRRMFEALGHEVKELDRTHYAGLDLTGLRRYRWRRLQPHEVNALRRKVKLKTIVFA